MDKLYKLFSNKASLYADNRPSYSSNFLKYMKEELGFTPTALGADIGCGTGQLTKILAGYFNFLYAVEPNDSMMKECQKRLYDCKNIDYICRCADSTGIGDNMLDYVTVAQAFHLFHNVETLREIKRILKPEGQFIIVYNMKNHSSNLFIKNEEVLIKHCPLYRRDFHATEFKNDSFQNCFTKDSFRYCYFPNDNTEYLDCDTFINRTLSASYAIQEGNPSFSIFLKELATVFEDFSVDNKVKLELSTVIYSGCLRSTYE